MPLAPGTWGTLVGIPLAYWTTDWDFSMRLCFWITLFALGTWSAKVWDEVHGTSDNQSIVIDEVVGYGITAWTIGHHSWGILVAFIAFRFFDIVKPPPVRQVDRWSHRAAQGSSSAWAAWLQGFGVMADDAVAGLQGLAVLALLQWFNFFS